MAGGPVPLPSRPMPVADVTPQASAPPATAMSSWRLRRGSSGPLGRALEPVQATSGELRGDDRANGCHQGEQSKRPYLEPRAAGGSIRQHPLAAGHHHQDGRLRPRDPPSAAEPAALGDPCRVAVPPRRGLARLGPSCCRCRLVLRTASDRRRGRTMAGRLLLPGSGSIAPPTRHSSGSLSPRSPERRGRLHLPVVAFAGLVLTAAPGLVPATCPTLVRVAIPLVGSAWRLGALVARGIVAISRTSRPGWRRVAGRRTRGQRRPTPRPHRHYRRAGLGVLCDEAESSPDEGPNQRAYDNQNLATTAKRSVHRASKLEHNPDNVANARRAKPRELELALSA
jgi:hypothetical protein